MDFQRQQKSWRRPALTLKRLVRRRLRASPLHVAASNGHLEVMSVLLAAGASPNSRGRDGSTPMSKTAAGAMLMLSRCSFVQKRTRSCPVLEVGVSLEVVARNGYPEVVRELIGQFGIEGCGGASSGTRALDLAVVDQHLDIVAMLTDAGVVYTGAALRRAAGFGLEACVKFLLQHHHQDNALRRRAFVNYRDEDGTTPLLCGIGFPYFVSPSPRIVRMLVDAGADTTSPVPLTNSEGRVEFAETPLSLASRIIRGMDKDGGGDEGEDLLHRLEAIRRVLLLRVEAVHAVSWLWQSHPRWVAEGASTTKATSASLARMLPLLRRRARRHGVSWATLFGWVVALW